MEAVLFAIGVGILCYIVFIFVFPRAVPSDQNERTKNVLKQIDSDTKNMAGAKDRAIIRDDYSDLSPAIQQIYQLPIMRQLYRLILQAGYYKKAGLIIVIMLALMAGITIALASAGMSAVLSLLIGVVGGYVLLSLFFKRTIKKRNAAFLDLFPEVLDMIVRSVRSGFPLATALQMVADNMDEPVKREFVQVTEEISLGRPLTEALGRMANRINESDIRFFVVILTIQQETGGNLAETLNNLSNIIRKRKQLRMKIKAMTAEGRTTAWVLGMVPVFVFGVLYFVSDDYLTPLFSYPGYIALAISGLLVVGCIALVYKMVDMDV